MSTITNNNNDQLNAKWSNNIDDLINDEYGRKLFSYYLKDKYNNDHVLMLYMIFECLLQCINQEQLTKILKITYNTYFKPILINNQQQNNNLIKLILNDNETFFINLCVCLEKTQFDKQLINNAKLKLKNFLNLQCYNDFLNSSFYMKCVCLLNNKQFLKQFLNVKCDEYDDDYENDNDNTANAASSYDIKNQIDEQVNYLVNVVNNHKLYNQFINEEKLNNSIVSNKSFNNKSKTSKTFKSNGLFIKKYDYTFHFSLYLT